MELTVYIVLYIMYFEKFVFLSNHNNFIYFLYQVLSLLRFPFAIDKTVFDNKVNLSNFYLNDLVSHFLHFYYFYLLDWRE